MVFPDDGTDIVTFSGSVRSQRLGWMYGNYGSAVKVDGRTGMVVEVSTPATQGLRDKLSNLAYPLHSGEYALDTGEWIVCTVSMVLGLTPGLLAVTGYLLWRKSWRAGANGVRRKS